METVLLSLQGAGHRPRHPGEGKMREVRIWFSLACCCAWAGEMLVRPLTGTDLEVFSKPPQAQRRSPGRECLSQVLSLFCTAFKDI